MSEPKVKKIDPFEGETCVGCRAGDVCVQALNKTRDRFEEKCEKFAPSYNCRLVRALETLSDLALCLRADGSGGCTFDVT